jgi:glycosyltransferase involved in cell wall biosynthesis
VKSSEQGPEVSVLMPVYNAERHVGGALDSALRQTFTNLEVVCVDDGSTDGSLKILREYAAKDPRICIITRGNFGTLHARITAVQASHGQFLLCLDADDELELDIVQKALATAKATGVDIVKFTVRVRGPGDRFFRPYFYDSVKQEHLGKIYHRPQLFETVAASNNYSFLSYGRLIRRATFFAAIGEVPQALLDARHVYSEDFVLASLVTKHGQSMIAIPDNGYRHHWGRDRSVTNMRARNFDSFLKKVNNECAIIHHVYALFPPALGSALLKARMYILVMPFMECNFGEAQEATAMATALDGLRADPAAENLLLATFFTWIYNRTWRRKYQRWKARLHRSWLRFLTKIWHLFHPIAPHG